MQALDPPECGNLCTYTGHMPVKSDQALEVSTETFEMTYNSTIDSPSFLHHISWLLLGTGLPSPWLLGLHLYLFIPLPICSSVPNFPRPQ